MRPRGAQPHPMRRSVRPIAATLAALAFAGVLGVLVRPWPGFAAAAAVLLWTAAVGVVVAKWIARRLQREYEVSIDQTIRALDAVRDGVVAKVPLVGPPDMQALMRRVNMATMAAEERKRQSQANLISLEVAFDRIHSVLNSLSEGVIVIDGRREVVIANPAARARLRADHRADQKVLEGRAVVDLLEGDLRERVSFGLDQLAARGEGRTLITGVVHRDRVLDVSIVRVRSNRPDQDFGTVLVFVDVTATHEMARLKDRFLSSVSHELRTPLTNICSFSELLEQQLRESSDAECREFADIIQKEGRRLTLLVEDVLDYNALETETIAWDDVLVDIADVVATSVERAQSSAASKFVQLESLPIAGKLEVRGDRIQLAKVMNKLIDNALKFTPGGGTVRVEVRSVSGFVQVSVSDSGIGVPAEHREAIFEKFTQLGDTLTGKPAGAGLGLAISRRIIDRCGGKIWCSPSELGGACLNFVLPIAAPVPADRG